MYVSYSKSIHKCLSIIIIIIKNGYNDTIYKLCAFETLQQ